MSLSLRGEHARLKRVFGAALIAASPWTLIQACGTSDAPVVTSADAATDHTLSADSQSDVNLAADAIDATFDANCYSLVGTFDAGLDGDAYADPGCVYTLTCGLSNHLTTIGCQVYVTDEFGPDSIAPLPGCFVNEDSGCEGDVYAPDAPVTIDCIDCIGSPGGRRPAGLGKMRSPRATSALGKFLATMAHDEAASVHAFARLSRELAFHGAPRALQIAADRAMRDEMRHARVMAMHARTHGATPRAPRASRILKTRVRRLSAIARENAAEGCVSEAFGALMAHVQGERATDAKLRRTFARIAKDETRHAALSLSVDGWIATKLDAKSRARIRDVKAEAVTKLDRALLLRGEKNYDGVLGRPSPGEARALLAAMTREISRTTGKMG